MLTDVNNSDVFEQQKIMRELKTSKRCTQEIKRKSDDAKSFLMHLSASL